jgi:hypothetical protein
MDKDLTKTNRYIKSAVKRHSMLQVSVATSSAVEGVRVLTFGNTKIANSSLGKAVKRSAVVSSKSRKK